MSQRDTSTRCDDSPAPKQVLRCWSHASTAAIEVLSRLLVQDQQTEGQLAVRKLTSPPARPPLPLLPVHQLNNWALGAVNSLTLHTLLESQDCMCHFMLFLVFFFFFCISKFRMDYLHLCFCTHIICRTMTSFHTFIPFSTFFFTLLLCMLSSHRQ